MNKKVLLITVILLLVVFGVAATLYPKLSAGVQNQQLATNPTTEPTEPAQETIPQTEPETTEPTEPETTEPEPIAAPDFAALDWEGNEVHFSDFVGKPIVLSFWAHWCDACQMQMPEFNSAQERLEGEVIFLMVHDGAAVEKGKARITEGGYTFPVIFDVDSQASNIYGISALPTTLFVDEAGNLQAYYVGAMGADLLQQGIDLIYTAE